jgi:diacylglycerol kinase family enzyme
MMHTAPPWTDKRETNAPGKGLAIVVNANAKRGGRRIAVQIAQRLPGARVRLTKSVQEIERWLKALDRPRCILAAGGDGSAIALVNALEHVTPKDQPLPIIGLLPLGTGNGWARALKAPKLDRCLRILSEESGALPTRSFGVFDVDGILAHFAGSGWDAMILDDYKQQLNESKGPARIFTKSVYGYVAATLLRTAPKVAIYGNPHLIIENLGDEVFTVSGDGKLLKVHDAGRGSVIYDGPCGVSSVGTVPEFGYGFKAFPFGERMLGYMNVRVYDRTAVPAVLSIPQLWKGTHPLRGMHDWFVTAARMTYSRPMPLQVGGDAHGARQTVEYRMSPRRVELLDWRRLI